MRNFVWVGLLACMLAKAAEEGPSFDDLTAYLERSQARTVEDFLNGMPPEFVGMYSLVHHSRSLQPSSPDSPRIVFGSREGATTKRYLFMGVGGHELQDGSDTVEVIEFAVDKPGFQFHRVSFLGADKPPRIEKDPRVCLTCHGTPLHPIWDTYGSWPGAYGSLTTNTGRPSEKWEVEEIGGLANKLATQPRYRRFGPPAYAGFEYMNDQIGNVLNRHLALTEASLFMASSDYRKVVPALQASRGGGDFVKSLPPDLQAAAGALYPQAVKDVCESLKRTAVNKIQRLIQFSGGRLERRIFDFWDMGSLDLEVRLLTLRRLLRLPTPDGSWSMQFPREIAATADGIHGLVMGVLYALSPPFPGLPHTIYNPQNGLVLDDNLHHLKLSFATETCGSIDASW